jgi:hypothetical protein
MHGWIKDHRKELHSNIWMMPPLYHRVWQYLKYKVNHKENTIPTKHGILHIPEGETITSLRCIAEAVSWYEYGVERIPAAKTIREVLDWLQNEGMITRDSNRKGTRIKVVNYSIYQGDSNGESNTEETQRKHRGSTNKNDKNVNKEQKDIDQFFESVWRLYPRKIGKGKIKNTTKKRLYELGIDTLKKCIERYEAEKEDWREWQHGSTFFNSGYIDYLDENYDPKKDTHDRRVIE